MCEPFFSDGQRDNRTDNWSDGHESHVSRNGSVKGTTTTTTPLPPWLQQTSQEPFISTHTEQNYMSSDIVSHSGSDRVNFVKSLPSPSPHFLFHRVFIDKTFDSHTRQPYRRPVLALTERETYIATSSTDENRSSLDAANRTAYQSSHGDAAKELTDKLDSISAAPKSSGELSQGKELSQDGDDEHGGNGDLHNVSGSTHHHHHHHYTQRLQTFKVSIDSCF